MLVLSSPPSPKFRLLAGPLGIPTLGPWRWTVHLGSTEPSLASSLAVTVTWTQWDGGTRRGPGDVRLGSVHAHCRDHLLLAHRPGPQAWKSGIPPQAWGGRKALSPPAGASRSAPFRLVFATSQGQQWCPKAQGRALGARSSCGAVERPQPLCSQASAGWKRFINLQLHTD